MISKKDVAVGTIALILGASGGGFGGYMSKPGSLLEACKPLTDHQREHDKIECELQNLKCYLQDD